MSKLWKNEAELAALIMRQAKADRRVILTPHTAPGRRFDHSSCSRSSSWRRVPEFDANALNGHNKTRFNISMSI
jgi:hypothetical protein